MPAKKRSFSESNPLVTRRPDIIPRSHPIENPSSDYVIPTPAIYELSEKVRHWLDIRTTGGMIFGLQRLGKTFAIRYIVKELKEVFEGNFETYFIPQIGSLNLSELVFFSHWLKGVGHAMHSSGTAYRKRQRLLHYLAEVGEKTSSRRIIIFVDEAQKLNYSHFDLIVDIRNELELQKVFLVVFLVGQPELKYMRQSLEDGGQMQIVGRFMTQDFQFFGLRNQKDVATCLDGYDNDSEYPPGSGWSYTRYYFPEAFELGWRLSKEAGKLWDVFSEVRARHGLAVVNEIPMEYFARTIEILLKKNSTLTSDFLGFSIAQCRKAVESSGYVGGSRYLVLPKNSEN